MGFGAFFVPVLSGVFNIGTVTGLVFFGSLFLWGMFGRKLKPKLKTILKEKKMKTVAGLLAAVVIFAAAAAAVETACIVKSVYNMPKDKNVTLIVLGCKVNGKTPSLMLSERINAAKEFLTNNPDANCVLSGGQGEDEEISEAECMFNVLVGGGIDPKRLYLEDKSTSTKENIEYSLNIIKKNCLNETVAVVTNEFHEYRASLVAEELGLDCFSVPAKTAPWLFPTYLVREWYAVIYEVLFR